MFVKLGPKHASKDEIELAIFEVFGAFLFVVRDLGLLLAVLGSQLRLAVLFLVHFGGYNAHTQASMQLIQAHKIYRLSSNGEENSWNG
jgi:hypothetical protein